MKHWNTLTRTLTLLCGTALVSGALAADHPRSPGINARQHAQHQRIHQGARSGELTLEERKKLQAGEKALRAEERAYKADGNLTVAERKDLHQDAKQASRDIHQQKHDGDARPAAPLPPRRPPDPGVNGRQHLQQGRVAQGVRSGQLTQAEAARLRQEQKAIRAEERAYKSDGKLTVVERKDLHQDQNQASKDIYQEKHDAETRAPAVPPSPAPVPKK